MLGTVLFVKETKVTRQLPPFEWGEFLRGLISPLRDDDFRWVFLTRFLMVMGTYTVQEFLQYFRRDVVKDFSIFGHVLATNAESAVSFFIIGLLLGAIISSLVAGILYDRFGRQFIVYVSSTFQDIVPLVFIFFFPLWLVWGLGVGFGFWVSAYQALQ